MLSFLERHYYQGGNGSGLPYDRLDGLGIEPSQGLILIKDTVVEHNYGDGLDSRAIHTVIAVLLSPTTPATG